VAKSHSWELSLQTVELVAAVFQMVSLRVPTAGESGEPNAWKLVANIMK